MGRGDKISYSPVSIIYELKRMILSGNLVLHMGIESECMASSITKECIIKLCEYTYENSINGAYKINNSKVSCNKVMMSSMVYHVVDKIESFFFVACAGAAATTFPSSSSSSHKTQTKPYKQRARESFTVNFVSYNMLNEFALI